jgi:SAM-dependent methyltransferase
MKQQTKPHYSETFFVSRRANLDLSARVVLGYVLERLRPASIVDFGCGTGTWLGVAGELGVNDCIGLDGDYVNLDHLEIPRQNFIPTDLSGEINLNRTFDLAISLEVAEHIGASNATTFVKNICRHSSVILFSAALPGQGGVYHVNEQYLSYWVELFNQQGFRLRDCIRGLPGLWKDKSVKLWYRQNTVMFFQENLFEKSYRLFPEQPTMLDVVHPELFERETKILRYMLSKHPDFVSALLLLKKKLSRKYQRTPPPASLT